MPRYKRKKLVGIIALLLAMLAGYGWWQYRRQPVDLEKVSPAVEISAAAIIAHYVKDEARANALYLGKVIQVAGTISSIQHQPDTLVNLLLGQPGDLHQVSCLLDKKYQLLRKPLIAGEAVIIRGQCTGFLMDVELNRCIVLTPP